MKYGTKYVNERARHVYTQLHWSWSCIHKETASLLTPFLPAAFTRITLLCFQKRMGSPQWATAVCISLRWFPAHGPTLVLHSSSVHSLDKGPRSLGERGAGGYILSPLQGQPTSAWHKPLFGATGVNTTVSYLKLRGGVVACVRVVLYMCMLSIYVIS